MRWHLVGVVEDKFGSGSLTTVARDSIRLGSLAF